MTPPPGAQERAKTANECLSNRIMALRDTRCEAHKHYLCDLCAGQWITDAIAQAVQAERERYDALYTAALVFCHFIETKLKHGRGSRKEIELERAVRAIADLRARPAERCSNPAHWDEPHPCLMCRSRHD